MMKKSPQNGEVLSIFGPQPTDGGSSRAVTPARYCKLPPCNLAPKLLVEWEPEWRKFLSSLRPAMSRSAMPLAGECRGKIRLWSKTLSFAAHVAFIFLLLTAYRVQQASRVLLQAETQQHPYEVIYFSGPYLPPVEDRGGALTGVSGRSGGNELKHIQNIRIARGTHVSPTTVDAPDLKLPRTDKPVANLLAVHPVAPPAPVQALHSMLAKLGLVPDVVPPAPKLDLAQHGAPQLSADVAPPPPDATALHDKFARRMTTDVVPPPVSAPVRDTDTIARLRLPAPEVVGPPPSAISRTRALPHGIGGSPQVAPPAPELAGVRTGGSPHGSVNGVGSADVVPPPPNVTAVKNGGSPHGSPNGVGSAEIVPPPPSGTQIAEGALNSAMNAINSAMRAAGVGRSDATGVIASAHPGKDLGIPNGAASGEMALSTTGGNTLGRGGSGGGTGIGHGTGPGNAASGKGPGSGVADVGPGAATGRGNSPYPGDGGAGSSPTASSSSGVWVSSRLPAGSVNIPSFSNSGDAMTPGHSPADPHRRQPSVTVVGTSRSGGALNRYGALPGSRVYTVYIDTDGGTAVLQYADADTSGKEFTQDLVAPEAVRAQVPADLRSAQFVVSCIVDRSGLLRDFRVLQNSAPGAVARVIAMLQDWRFRPVLRGNAAIEVNAIVGFNVDTR